MHQLVYIYYCCVCIYIKERENIFTIVNMYMCMYRSGIRIKGGGGGGGGQILKNYNVKVV